MALQQFMPQRVVCLPDLAQGQMQWSNVTGGSSNPGVRGNFEDAILIPEPTSLMLMALGGLAMLSRRR